MLTADKAPTLPFAVVFGPATGVPLAKFHRAGLCLPIPVLGGERMEIIFPGAAVFSTAGGLELATTGELLLGHVSEPIVDARSLATQTQSLYQRILAGTRGRHLYRIWNYVPRINALTDGFESYRAFCQGRSLAFEAEAGAGFPQVLPSASAVGTAENLLTILFVAGPAHPRHFENPEQVPAYRYPAEHGPRPPSFSRATIVSASGLDLAFISGTAAIKGHKTFAPGALDAQLTCTLDNLRLISRAIGLGDDLGAGRSGERHFKIYLRHAEDFPAVQRQIEHTLLRAHDHVIYLQADICRAALNVEIEATLVARAS